MVSLSPFVPNRTTIARQATLPSVSARRFRLQSRPAIQIFSHLSILGVYIMAYVQTGQILALQRRRAGVCIGFSERRRHTLADADIQSALQVCSSETAGDSLRLLLWMHASPRREPVQIIHDDDDDDDDEADDEQGTKHHPPTQSIFSPLCVCTLSLLSSSLPSSVPASGPCAWPWSWTSRLWSS